MTFLVAILSTTLSFAASDGSLGLTSTGTSQISVTKQDQVRISGLSDVNFGATPDTPSQQFVDACIYSTSGQYRITASSSNPKGRDFRMANASGSIFVEYDIEWKEGAGGTSGTDLNSGSQSKLFSRADRSNQTCRGGKNARLFVQVDNNSFGKAPAGAYSDTLTIVVSPQ